MNSARPPTAAATTPAVPATAAGLLPADSLGQAHAPRRPRQLDGHGELARSPAQITGACGGSGTRLSLECLVGR